MGGEEVGEKVVMEKRPVSCCRSGMVGGDWLRQSMLTV